MTVLSAEDILAASDRRQQEATCEEALQGRLSAAFAQEFDDFEEQVNKLRCRVRARGGDPVSCHSDEASTRVPKVPSLMLPLNAGLQPVAAGCASGAGALLQPPSAQQRRQQLQQLAVSDWSRDRSPAAAVPSQARCSGLGDAMSWVGRAFGGFGEAVMESLEVMVTTCNAETLDRPKGVRRRQEPGMAADAGAASSSEAAAGSGSGGGGEDNDTPRTAIVEDDFASTVAAEEVLDVLSPTSCSAESFYDGPVLTPAMAIEDDGDNAMSPTAAAGDPVAAAGPLDAMPASGAELAEAFREQPTDAAHRPAPYDGEAR